MTEPVLQRGEYKGPLAGLNVIDFGHYYAGPMAAMLLADQGANVIRIVRSGEPELPAQQYRLLNRNKKLLTVDLKTAEGKKQALSLIEKADVVIENFRPGVMKRLGLDYPSIKASNPGLVYLSLPGFASTDKERAHIQAWEGVIAAAAGGFTHSNLLREGLDMPEVSLVAILDADKEGFLRSERSLIQTIGRAARNLNGRAILYADRITGSMERAIGETERRREKQVAFNLANGIVPKGVVKDITDIMEGANVPGPRSKKRKGMAKAAEESARYEAELRTPGELAKRIKVLEEKMYQLARDLEFEAAAQMRDEIAALRARLITA